MLSAKYCMAFIAAENIALMATPASTSVSADTFVTLVSRSMAPVATMLDMNALMVTRYGFEKSMDEVKQMM